MKRLSWQTKFSLVLIALSALSLFIHYIIFNDSHRILVLLVEDLALVFVNVLLVTLVIQKLLSDREKRAKLEKLNMVIGAFFSEVGTKLLSFFSSADPNVEKIRKELVVTDKWSNQEFSLVRKQLRSHDYIIDFRRVKFEELREFLVGKRNFLLRLLENPNLLEHESFTELLRAVFHMTEELGARGSLRKLPSKDYEHLAGDMKRAYTILVREWLDYMKYLKGNYPYLFSLAMRTNPFDSNASPIVK